MFESELNHWWDKARRRIVFGLIKKYSRSSDVRPKILDLGCGMGAIAQEAQKIGDYYGVDVSEKAVNFCKRRGIENVKQGDALHVPYEDDQFDIVLLLDTIEHVEDDFGVMDEVRRVLRPQGMVIVTAPAFKFLWGPSDVTFQHFRRYRLGELKARLERKDFSIIKSSYFNFFLFLPIFLGKMAVKYLRLPISENEVSRQGINGIWIINKILYYIFYTESMLLKYIDFPFGVSAMVIGRKR